MAFLPASFDNVEVLQVAVNDPTGGNTLFIVTGVAIINFSANSDDWNRDDCVFLVPAEGETSPVETGGQPLIVGSFIDSVVSAYPATIDNPSDETHGWGIDSVDSTSPDGVSVQVTARVVVRGEGPATLLRMGFHVSILGAL